MKSAIKPPRPICGAMNRRGLPCQCKLLLRGRRCKFHGGMSTGPRTPEGKARAALNLRKDRAAHTAATSASAEIRPGHL